MKQLLCFRRIVGDSMMPTFHQGQVVLGSSLGRPKVGNVVIFRHQGLDKIKRVNEIKGHRFYVIGDNPGASTDSRQFGYIDQSQIIAKIFWP